jgi:Holliday junction resolvasome RuvABC endonuclease subunit
MTIYLGIDPGSTETAYCRIDENYNIYKADKIPNDTLIDHQLCGVDHIAVESIQSYGMAVGRSIFDTTYMIGRIIQKAIDLNIPYTLYPRPEYARAICGVGKINDKIVRQSLELRFGGYNKGEALNLLKGNSDKRSAFAVAVYHVDMMKGAR